MLSEKMRTRVAALDEELADVSKALKCVKEVRQML